MDLNQALESVLTGFERYYRIERESVTSPFAAEAVFHQHDEQYFLIKSAKLSESDSSENVFFATTDTLDEAVFSVLDEKAWETGLSRVTPKWNQKGADVVLVILTNGMDAAAAERIRRVRRTRSYALSLKGWSNYRVIAIDLSSGEFAYNRLGQSLEKVLRNILFKKGNDK